MSLEDRAIVDYLETREYSQPGKKKLYSFLINMHY